MPGNTAPTAGIADTLAAVSGLAYEAPTLTALGSLRELTASTGGTPKNDLLNLGNLS